MPLFALRPGLRIKLGPIVPALFWRKRGEMAAAGAGIEGFAARFSFFAGGVNPFVAFFGAHWFSNYPSIECAK